MFLSSWLVFILLFLTRTTLAWIYWYSIDFFFCFPFSLIKLFFPSAISLKKRTFLFAIFFKFRYSCNRFSNSIRMLLKRAPVRRLSRKSPPLIESCFLTIRESSASWAVSSATISNALVCLFLTYSFFLEWDEAAVMKWLSIGELFFSATINLWRGSSYSVIVL